MCEFFSAIVFRSGDVRFCESDSHETLIERLGLDDSVSIYMRPWVRVECTGDAHDDVQIDEEYCPSWVTADRDELNERVIRARARLLPLYEMRQRMHHDIEEQYNKEYHDIEARYDRVYEAHAEHALWPDEEGAPSNRHDDILVAAKKLNSMETREWQSRYDVVMRKPQEAYVAAMSKFFGYTPEPDTKPEPEPDADMVEAGDVDDEV